MNSRLDRIRDWTDLAKRAEFDCQRLACLCDVSLRQLERYSKLRFARCPQSWLNDLRLIEAQRLLKSGLTIKEAAYALGFKQASHFCRKFKSYTGVTPTRFVSEG